jgi:glycosyltransferase involved in cell wall biosynthesis/SAM-dependent methyltransferase
MKIAALYPWGHLKGERQAGASQRFGLMLDHLAAQGAEIRVLTPGGWHDFEKAGITYLSLKSSPRDKRRLAIAHACFRLFTLVATLGRVGSDDFMLWYHLEWRLRSSFQPRLKDVIQWADVVMVEYTFWAGAADRYRRPGTPLIVSNYDVLSHQVRPRLLRALTEAIERGGLRRADKAICVSADDQRVFRSWGVETEVIPHAADLAAAYQRSAVPDSGGLDQRKICLFVGSNFEANIRAVDAIRRVAQVTRERYGPEFCEFIVVGGCALPERSINFEALGIVGRERLDELYRIAAVVVVPLPFGTGSSVKTIEAMAYGRAVLGTTVAFRGYPTKSGIDCEIEDNLETYPERLAELLTDDTRRQAIERNARAFAQRYDYHEVNQRYVGLIEAAVRDAAPVGRVAAAQTSTAQPAPLRGLETTTCRVCDSQDLRRVLDLGEQPWCNNFLREDQLGREPRYPLRLVRCDACGTAQLDYTVPKEVMFTDHTYLSGTTRTLSEHFLDVAIDVDGRFLGDVKGKSVLDIGSNDGTQLKHYKRLGYDVLGVEPAAKPSELARRDGIATVQKFFNRETARGLDRKFHVVNAAGVFFHLEELHSVTEGIKEVLRQDGVFVIQFLYMKSILENVAFDQIYHEHLLYYTLRTIDVLLKRHGLELFDAYLSPIHGGSVMGFATHTGGRAPTPRLQELRQREEAEGTNELTTYTAFAGRIARMKSETLNRLWTAKAQGKRIYGYGAPAKGNTLLNYFRIGTEVLDYLVEKNPLRRGLYSPGMHIPIVLENELRTHPNMYYVLAWNFRDEILQRNRRIIELGVEFYFPVIPKALTT